MSKVLALGLTTGETVSAKEIEDITNYFKYVQDITDNQVTNGLLTEEESKEILAKLSAARNELDATPPGIVLADGYAREAFSLVVAKVNQKSKAARLWYLWAVPLWFYLISLSIIFLLMILFGTLNTITLGIENITGNILIWGGLGGSAYSVYDARQKMRDLLLTKYGLIFYLVYPLAGMIFGLALVFLVAGSLLSLSAKPTPAVYAGIAFLGGLFQHWAISTLQDIANAVHEPKTQEY